MDRLAKTKIASRRVLIPDDHKMMREALRSLLEGKLGYECVAESRRRVRSGETSKECHPDMKMRGKGSNE